MYVLSLMIERLSDSEEFVVSKILSTFTCLIELVEFHFFFFFFPYFQY